MDLTQPGISPLALALMQGAGSPGASAGLGMPAGAPSGIPYGLAPQGIPQGAPVGGAGVMPAGVATGVPYGMAPQGVPTLPAGSVGPGLGQPSPGGQTPGMGGANMMPRQMPVPMGMQARPFGFGSVGYGGLPYQG